MTRTLPFLLLFVFAWTFPGAAQASFSLSAGKGQAEIPFEYTNDFIILTLNFNGSVPLRFIYDTGAEHTILSKRQVTDMLKIPYEREFRIMGSDLQSELIAYLVRNIRLDIPNKVSATRQDVLVLQEDYFRFEEYAGIAVQGILSGHIFSKFIVKINYQTHILTLYDRDLFKLREPGFVEIPVELFRNKIYLHTTLQVQPDSTAPVKLLLDTGAGLPLLLFANTHPLLHPPASAISSNIGMGLGGYLEGFTGRVSSFDIGPFLQTNVLTYFQNLDSTQRIEYLNKRNGLIGNVVLERFHLIIDYQNGKIWLKPAKNYNQPFVYDRSGLNVIASGIHFNTLTVQNVLPNSPAAEADIQRGDIILRVNLLSANLLSLTDLQKTFQKKPGKKIKITVIREGKKIKKTFVLRDLI